MADDTTLDDGYDDAYLEEDEVDLNGALDEEFGDDDDAEPETETEDYGSNEVTLAGRTFTIEEPSIGIIIRILKVFGQLAVRGERAALRQLQAVAKNPQLSNRVVLFGMLAAFSEADLIALGAAVLQFPDPRAGRKWLRSVKLELSPIIRAFFLNLAQSEDLRNSIEDFFTGLGMAGGILEKLNL